jgi:hypothetical protein
MKHIGLKIFLVIFLFVFVFLIFPAKAALYENWYENDEDHGRMIWPRLPSDREIEAAAQNFEQKDEWSSVVPHKTHRCYKDHVINQVILIAYTQDINTKEPLWTEPSWLHYDPTTNTFLFPPWSTDPPPPLYSMDRFDELNDFNGWSTDTACGGVETGEPETPPGEPVPWTVIIGAIGALGAAGVAGAAVMAKKKGGGPESKEKKEKKKPVQYILQFLPESLRETAVGGVVHLSAGPGKPASFTVLVKKRLADGTILPAPEAQIAVFPRPGISGISVVPGGGSGQVNCTVNVDPSVTAATAELAVAVSGVGGGFSASVIVDISESAHLDFR